MLKELIGRKTEIIIIDPWEIGGQSVSGVIGAVDHQDSGIVLVKLDKAFLHENASYEYLVGSPRHENRNLDELLEGKTLTCGFTHTTPDRAASDKPCDISWWRGGLAMIGDMKVLK